MTNTEDGSKYERNMFALKESWSLLSLLLIFCFLEHLEIFTHKQVLISRDFFI